MSDSDDEQMFGFSDMEIPERKNLANVCLDLHEEAEGEESDPNEEGEVVTLEDESMKTVKSQKVKKKSVNEVNLEKREARERAHKEAAADFKAGKFKNLNQAAKAHGVSHCTLYRGMKEVWEGSREEEVFPGSGKKFTRFTAEEERKISDVIVWSAKIGYGFDWAGLQDLVQEALLALTAADPSRKTGLESSGHRPDKAWVRRFASRHNLVVRMTMEISKGRQFIRPEDIALWQADACTFLNSDPELAEALLDPSRIWNQDETSVQVCKWQWRNSVNILYFKVGVTGKKVLAPRGIKVLYQVASSSRDHMTCSFSVNARGDIAPPRCVFQGVRNVAASHLKDLPKEGHSGVWQLCVTQKGYITAESFLDVLRDLEETLVRKAIPRPVILFLDGAAPHISLAMAEFCKAHGIQPWVLKPNSTHLLQPLDLTFLKVLKVALKRKCLAWQQDPLHVGNSLTKYTVVILLREAVEEVLKKSPDTIASGFRRAGLYPWDPSAIDQDKMLPSSVFAPLPGAASENPARPDTPSSSREELLEHSGGEEQRGGCSAQKNKGAPVVQNGTEEQVRTPVEQSTLKPQTTPVEPTSAKSQDDPLHVLENAKTKLETFQLVFLTKAKLLEFEESWRSKDKKTDTL